MNENIDTRAMPPETARLFKILRWHKGKAAAISMADLYANWSNRSNTWLRDPRNIATLSRHMRKLIDDLRDIYSVPVMSSSKAGYWIAADDAEVKEVCREFRARGLKSLTTSARLARISVTQEVEQLALDLRRTPWANEPP